MPRVVAEGASLRQFANANEVLIRQAPGIEGDSEDIPDGPTTTTVLTVGGSAITSTDVDNDGDWVRVDLVAGQSYTFTVNGS